MIETGKHLENIVEKLIILRSEVEIKSALGLTNINKHCENFLKRVLNLVYGYELENLNQADENFPGLDLGDTGEKIAYQITSTKKSEKVDETLSTCLKKEHYLVFDKINIFILTKKQGSYTIKTVTQPHFNFDAEKNIIDFDDLIKDIRHLPPYKMNALSDYINTELKYTIDSLNGSSKPKTPEKKLLNVITAIEKTRMPYYSHWRSEVSFENKVISVPELHKAIYEFFKNPYMKMRFAPTLFPGLGVSSGLKEMTFLHEIVETGISNWYYGHSMQIEPSTINFETADYSNEKPMFCKLQREISGLIGQILFLSSLQKNGIINIKVDIRFVTNTQLFFYSEKGVIETGTLYKTYELDNNIIELTETLSDIKTATLVELLQKILHGFIAKRPSPFSSGLGIPDDPFLAIDSNSTAQNLSRIKQELGLADS